VPLGGVIPPLVTPFLGDGTVDRAGFEANLALLADADLAGFLVLGSNGEAAVADASPIPVFLYSVPAFTALPWPPGLAASLATHPRIAGLKESSGDLGLLGRIVASVPSTFEVACGNAPVFYPALCAGAAG
jgi:dihydrodipicolinate synthase/N-acetylneuraminate lyase